MSKAVLAIGIDPHFVDMSQFPGLTPELIQSHIDTQVQRVRALGYDADSCLTDLGDTAEAMVTEALRAHSYDCVVIGAGLKDEPDRLLLFEKILNIVHAMAPQARICFNRNPADTVDAVQRWINQ
jgi:hypothetical protein